MEISDTLSPTVTKQSIPRVKVRGQLRGEVLENRMVRVINRSLDNIQ